MTLEEFQLMYEIFFEPYRILLLLNNIPGTNTTINVFDIAKIVPKSGRVEKYHTDLHELDYSHISKLLRATEDINVHRISPYEFRFQEEVISTTPDISKLKIASYIKTRAEQPVYVDDKDQMYHIRHNMFTRKYDLMCTLSIAELNFMLNVPSHRLYEMLIYNTSILEKAPFNRRIKWLGEYVLIPINYSVERLKEVTAKDPPHIPYTYKGTTYTNKHVVTNYRQYGLL